MDPMDTIPTLLHQFIMDIPNMEATHITQTASKRRLTPSTMEPMETIHTTMPMRSHSHPPTLFHTTIMCQDTMTPTITTTGTIMTLTTTPTAWPPTTEQLTTQCQPTIMTTSTPLDTTMRLHFTTRPQCIT